MSHAGPWAICDRCGHRVRHNDCRTEWTGLFVCSQYGCYDPRLVYLDPPYVSPKEGIPVKNARLDNTDYTFADDDNPVTPEDL